MLLNVNLLSILEVLLQNVYVQHMYVVYITGVYAWVFFIIG